MNDATPDVRAAIAEVIWFSERDSSTGGVPAKLPPDMAKRVNAIYDRLAQMGALRSVGDGVSKQDVLGAAVLFANAAHRCHLQGDDHDDDGECEHALQHLYSLIDRLPIPDAAARAGDGAT